MTIVTRFAPSPTGYLHIGSLRTVLYNYLYTKQHDGKFMLRIEDTDRTRLVEVSAENLQEVLASVGLIPDEGPNNPGEKGPYFQSERLDIYQTYIKKLIENGHAYYCFCSSERLDELRTEQQELGLPTKYDKKCRYLTPEEVQANLDAGLPYTIRLAVPEGRDISFTDTIRGKISVPSKDVDDQVLIKTDGFPTYHFAVVVDDYLMGVTDIIRGDEWIPSTPKHVLLYEAFGWEMPRYSHVPPLIGNDKKKLSKRTGDVSVEIFLQKGYIHEAILNYIALLGWNPKTTEEIFSLSELIKRFKLEDVHKAGAVFDIERLEWFNSRYILSYSIETLEDKLKIYLRRYNPKLLETMSQFPIEYNRKILSELQTRLKILSEYEELTHFFYHEKESFDTSLFINSKMKISTLEEVRESLEFAYEILNNDTYNFEVIEDIKDIFIQKISEAGKKNGQILWPVRVALSGEKFSPGALELIYIFGREKSMQKIQKSLKLLS
ncbi:glutamate--tRNA ligase [Candidatus Gracilibacteria bacterium]|nr:glutamate--tRNA ligase [Candidatus Gracilibacteria bacterium]